MIKLSELLETPSMAQVVRERDTAIKKAQQSANRKAKRLAKAEEEKRRAAQPHYSRQYGAAKASRLNSDWETIPTAGNYELRTSLRTLRARARQQSRDNGIFKKFLSMTRRNIIGKGIQLQCNASYMSGGLNAKLNLQVETAFREWSYKENCTVSRKMSFLDAQNLVITTLVRDGEVLIQKVKADNPFGFALKFIDVSYLDEMYNEQLRGGRRVIMSVEVDENDMPTAYYLTTPSGDSYLPQTERLNRVRVPADEILHFYLFSEDEAQTRGVTWFHTALRDAKDLDGYKVGVISSARASAYTYGMVIPPENIDDVLGDDPEQARPSLELSIEPLTIQELPPGYDFRQFDPKQPTQNHSEFYKAMLQDLAMSLDLNYFSMAGDLSGVNYSSARVGLLDERELWKTLQDFVIEHFHREVYQSWLREAVLIGKLRLSAKDYADSQNPNWRPRGWSWVDPQKEINAQVMALQTHISSITDVLAEQGKDVREHFAKIKAERELAKEYGIDLTYMTTQTAIPEDDGSEDVDAIDTIKREADAYGVGVRAGVITPQLADENLFRTKLGLPPMSGNVEQSWDDDGGFRRPITLVSTDGSHPSGGAPPPDNASDDGEDVVN